MKLYDFIKLNEYEQAESVWRSQFIADRTDGDSTILLYCLGEFFVEVTYDQNLNKIMNMKPFKTMRLLEPYWQEVQLTDLDKFL